MATNHPPSPTFSHLPLTLSVMRPCRICQRRFMAPSRSANAYKRAEEEINGHLMEGRYSVSRLRLLTGSLEAVQLQARSLQNLQEELEKQESSVRRFGAVTHQLLRECHPSVSASLNHTLRDANASLQEEISERLRGSRALLQLWQRHQELREQSGAGVLRQEEQAQRLLKATCGKELADEEEVSERIHECSELLRSQAPVQASLQVLQELGEQLRQQVDTSAAAAVQTDHLTLCQRLAAVEQALTRQLTTLQVGGGGGVEGWSLGEGGRGRRGATGAGPHLTAHRPTD
ncbi:hypothetical protein CRUP_026784 [Coryphaenoides rupestris]|nr:hypothetical protein CRUP_026784 [Coryphaenoides rupestris]